MACAAVRAGLGVLHGTVTTWEDPGFAVLIGGDGSFPLGAKSALVFDLGGFCDPGRFGCDFTRFHPEAVGGWRRGPRAVLEGGLELPAGWLRDATTEMAPGQAAEAEPLDEPRTSGQRHLEALAGALGG